MRLVWKLEPARLGAAAAIAALGAVAAWLTWPAAPSAPAPVAAETVPVPALRVAGHALPPGGDAVGAAFDLVRRYALGSIKLKLPDGSVKTLDRTDFGLEIDRRRLAEFVKQATTPGSAIARAHAASARAAEPIDVPLPLRIDGAQVIERLVDLKAEVDKPAMDAAMDVEKRTVRPEVVGHRLDVYGTAAKIEAAFRQGTTEVEADVEQVVPKRLAKELSGVRFDSVLGFYETRYNPMLTERTYNLRLAASKLDGMVLMPGETFDFNAVVGPRDEARGYRVAPVIAQGELVDGLGGGTCQVSGTLHAAAFFAGLEIVERYPHSRPSSYIELGLDATVAYPNITYRFRNPFDFPVVLHEKVAGGVVRAEVLGPERKLTVSYFRRIDGVLPFEEVERETDKLPAGKRVVTQRGIPGFVAFASRVVRDGAYAERTKWREKYPPTTQIVAVGTGPEETKPKLQQDKHPEYRVDEYLVVTQAPPAKKGERGTIVRSPTKGKTGVEGWIKALGFEKTPIEDEPEGDEKKDDKKKDAAADKSGDRKPKEDKPKKDEKPKKAADKPGKKKDKAGKQEAKR